MMVYYWGFVFAGWLVGTLSIACCGFGLLGSAVMAAWAAFSFAIMSYTAVRDAFKQD